MANELDNKPPSRLLYAQSLAQGINLGRRGAPSHDGVPSSRAHEPHEIFLAGFRPGHTPLQGRGKDRDVPDAQCFGMLTDGGLLVPPDVEGGLWRSNIVRLVISVDVAVGNLEAEIAALILDVVWDRGRVLRLPV